MSLLNIDKIMKSQYAFSKPIDFTEISYIKGVQLQKLLWLDNYKDAIHEALNDVSYLKNKTEIMHLTCDLFPGGVYIPYSMNLDDMINETNKHILKGTKYIYGATFYYDGILVVIDILEVTKKKIHIYEVCSHNKIHDMNIEAMSLQYYVLTELGYKIKGCSIVHINDDYVRGSSLDADKLFSISCVKSEVLYLQRKIPKNLNLFKTTLKENIQISCNENNQNKIPEKSIFQLFKLGSQKQRQLYSKGIFDIKKIPDNFSLTTTQQTIVDVYKSNKIFADRTKIKEFLNNLTYPIYHLSICSYSSEIPEFEDVRPYQDIPFKFSLDIEQKDGSIEHRECSCDNLDDPRYEVAKLLCENIPLDVTTLVYDKVIVDKLIRTLATPYNARTVPLMNIVKNLKDLSLPFQKNHYISPLQNLRDDFKSVSLALLPELEKEEKQKLLAGDCNFNTIASIKILEVLKKYS